MRAREFINEAGYVGNIGMQEMAKFFMAATEEQKKQLKELIAKGMNSEAWKMIQDVTGMKLVGKEFGDES